MSAQRQDKGWEVLIAERLEEEARMCPNSGLCLSSPCTCHSFKAASCIQTQKQPDSCPCLTPLDSFPSCRPGCRLCGTFLWRLLHLDLKTIPVFPSERSSWTLPFRPLAPADLEFQPQTPTCVSSWSKFYFIHLCSHGGSLAVMLSASSPEESIRS